MIMPGLLTASTSKADHFGMSADCVGCFSFCIVVAPSFGLFLRRCFPLAAKKIETTGAHSHHPQGRNEVEHLKRSAELCEWAVVKNRSEEGELVERNLIGWNEAKWHEAESLFQK